MKNLLPGVVQRHAHAQFVLPALTNSLHYVLLVAVVLLVSVAFLRQVPLNTSMDFSLGSIDRHTAHNFHAAETGQQDHGFRWTTGDSTLNLPPQGLGTHTLRMTISASRPTDVTVPLTITLNDQPLLVTNQPNQLRQYAFVVPASQIRTTENVVQIQSATFSPPQDARNRVLGVAVYNAEWIGLDDVGWLVPVQVLVITIATILLYALLVAARIPLWPRLFAVVLFVAILLAMRHTDGRFVYRWNAVLMTSALCVVLALAVTAMWHWRPSSYCMLTVPMWLGQHWIAGIGFLAITALMLNQLVLRFTTHIIGPPGDNYEYLWKMQWFSDALLKLHVSPAFSPQVFYPTGTDLAISEMTPTHTLLSVPVTALFGPIVSYNVVLFLSFALTAFFTYLLARRLGVRPGPAFVAGMIFGFCLRRYMHAQGHLGMMGTASVALAFYGWEGLLTYRRSWDGYVAGVGLVLATWSSLHYGTTLPVMLACYTVVRLGVRHVPDLLRHWQVILLSGALCVALALPLIQPYMELQWRGDTYQHRYAQVLLLSALPQAYLFPNPYHPLWGDWARQFYDTDRGEQFVALGYVATALALAGIWLGRRQRVVQALALLVLINLVLSFGPELQLSPSLSVPMPAKLLYDHVPIYSNIRTWGRMSIYVALSGALLAALALDRLPRRWSQVGWMLAAVAVLVESASSLTLSAPAARPVDLWLSQQPGSGAVAELPRNGGQSMYYTLFTAKPTNLGTGKFPPSLYREGSGVLDGFPNRESVQLLQRWHTDYVIVNEAALDVQRPRWRVIVEMEPQLVRVYQRDGYSVYRVLR